MKGWIVTIFMIIGVPALLAGLVLVPMARRAMQTQYVLAHGLPAQAVVVALQDTGNTINNRQVYRIVLRLQLTGSTGQDASVQRVLTGTDVLVFAPGRIVGVKYNPQDPRQVALVPGPG